MTDIKRQLPKDEMRALQQIMQYSGAVRSTKDVARSRWSPRFGLLNPGCVLFYYRCLTEYQGMTFTEILGREKKDDHIRTAHTLDKRLNLLIAKNMAMKDSLKRGRGIRGRYYFNTPKTMIDESESFWLSGNFVQLVLKDFSARVGQEEKAEEIAKRLGAVVLAYGCSLADMLNMIHHQRLGSKSKRDLFLLFDNQSMQIDLFVDLAAMRLIVENDPKVVEKALHLFASGQLKRWREMLD